MNSRQPIGILATCPQVLASVALLHAAMDETIGCAQMARDPKPADSDDVFSQSDDEFQYQTLSLGDASVDVGYLVVHDMVLVQGVQLADGWVDIDSFSAGVRKTWTQAIERELARAAA